MTEKKRKRQSGSTQEHEAKRPALEKPPGSVKVSMLDEEETWKPIIASSPGLSITHPAKYKAYKDHNASSPKLFLHSEEHPTLDITASEEPADTSPIPLVHYIGIYDSDRQRLKLVPARCMTIHSTLKSARPVPAAEEKPVKQEMKPSEAREALGLAFGTKKTRKMLNERRTNIMTSGKPIAEDPVATAVLESLPEVRIRQDDIQAAADLQRPIPRPNYNATRPVDVYPLLDLVGGEANLAKIKVRDWIDAANSGDDIPTLSLYISRRILNVCQNEDDVTTVRVLRYTYLLILFYKSVFKGKIKGRAKDFGRNVPKFDFSNTYRIPDSHDFAGVIACEFPKDVVMGTISRFSDGGRMTRWQENRLMTHIMALTLHIDGFETDTSMLAFDLNLEKTRLTSLYKELGCSMKTMSKKDAERLKLTNIHYKERKLAKLTTPVSMPKPRITPRPKGRR